MHMFAERLACHIVDWRDFGLDGRGNRSADGLGFYGKIIILIVGAPIGGLLFPKLGILGNGIVAEIIAGISGAVLLLVIVRLFRRRWYR